MKSYDGHLIIQNADKLNNQKKVDVIAQNSEKFINIGFDCLSVKDSFSFIFVSLDKLVPLTKYDNTDDKDNIQWILKTTGRTISDLVKIMILIKLKNVWTY